MSSPALRVAEFDVTQINLRRAASEGLRLPASFSKAGGAEAGRGGNEGVMGRDLQVLGGGESRESSREATGERVCAEAVSSVGLDGRLTAFRWTKLKREGE